MDALDSPIKNMNALETTTRIQEWEVGEEEEEEEEEEEGEVTNSVSQKVMRFHTSITKSNASEI